MKKILSLLIALVLVFACICSLNLTAFAAGSCSLVFSKKEVVVGEEVTVTVNISADEEIYGIEFAVNYDSAVLEFVSGDDCSAGTNIVNVAAGNTSSSASKRYVFKALKSGSCYISTSNMVCVNGNDELISVSNQGASLTVKDKELSKNANLKSLTISKGTLSPGFSSDKTSYSVEVENDVTSVKIEAAVADSSAKVNIVGGSDLKEGKNNCTVTVTAADGTQKVYNVVVTRKKAVSNVESSSKKEESSKVSSKVETSSKEETSEAVSSEEDSDEPEELKPLETIIEGKKYFILETLDGIDIPAGYNAQKSLHNEEEITIAVDKNQTQAIYYLGTTESDAVELYTYDFELDTFTKLEYIRQGERLYTFAKIPQDTQLPKGYYSTNSKIGDFNVSCYSNVGQEYSAFYYVYCFNGEEYGFYRYDSIENVMQRYPELNLQSLEPIVPAETEDIDEAGFLEKFRSLTLNAKLIVLGVVLVILAILTLLVLFTIKVLYRRGEAEFVSNLDYTEDFDSIEYNSAFGVEESENFLTMENDANEDAEEEIESDPEIESDYITEENK